MNYKNYDEKSIQTFEYETTMVSDGHIIGTCELGKATIQLINDSNQYSTFKGSWIKTVHGSFYIYDVSPVQEKVNIKLECYDIKYKLDTPYNSSHHTFPCILKEWRNSIFRDCGVEYDDSDFPNSDLWLENEPYIENNASNRTVMKMIAEAGASAVVTDENDKFYFSWFEDTIHKVNDWIELTTEKESSKPINTLVLGRGDVEDNVYYPQNKPSNPVEFRIDNNYILDPQDTTSSDDLRYDTRIPIYNQINGFSYLIFSMRSQSISNKLSVKLGHKIQYLDIWGNELTAYVMTKKINWLGGNVSNDDNYEITLSAEKISESSTDLSYAGSVKDDVTRVERKADKNAKKIEDLVSEVNQYDEKINTLEMTVDSTILNINHKYDFLREAEGKNQLKLDDSLEYQPIGFSVNGHTKKILYLYPISEIKEIINFLNIGVQNLVSRGFTINSSSSEIVINGTSYSGGSIVIPTKTNLKKGTYTIYFKKLEGTIEQNSKDFQIFVQIASDTTGRLTNITGSRLERGEIAKKTVTLEDDKDIFLYFYCNGAGLVATNYKIGIQIEEGNVIHDYIPYEKQINNLYPSDNLYPLGIVEGSCGE